MGYQGSGQLYNWEAVSLASAPIAPLLPPLPTPTRTYACGSGWECGDTTDGGQALFPSCHNDGHFLHFCLWLCTQGAATVAGSLLSADCA